MLPFSAPCNFKSKNFPSPCITIGSRVTMEKIIDTNFMLDVKRFYLLDQIEVIVIKNNHSSMFSRRFCLQRLVFKMIVWKAMLFQYIPFRVDYCEGQNLFFITFLLPSGLLIWRQRLSTNLIFIFNFNLFTWFYWEKNKLVSITQYSCKNSNNCYG